jgi:hypothetical protein
LASLAQEYFSNPAERARLNSKPGDLLFVIFAAVFMIMALWEFASNRSAISQSQLATINSAYGQSAWSEWWRYWQFAF